MVSSVRTKGQAEDNTSRRNATAVSRLFTRQAHQPAQAPPPPARHTTNVRQATAAEVVGRTLTSSAQPAWTDVRRRELLRDPSHDISSHVGQQLELAVAMETISPETHAYVLGHATSTHTEQAARAVGPASQSCFGLQLEKARHARALQHPQGTAAYERHEADGQQWTAYHHQQAILRYEQSLPQRRARDPYTQLTAAQQSTSVRIPNQYTAQELAARDGNRFVLDNAHRQHLRGGVPVMTRVMRGEYYYPNMAVPSTGLRRAQGGVESGESPSAGRAGRRSHSTGRLGAAAGRPHTDFVTANKRHVHVASRINREEHRQAAASRRSRSAKPYVTCRCDV